MPVLKVYKDGVWEEVAGVSGHTHNVDDIVDFPSSMPANGGNADTVDGKHASYFATATKANSLQTSVNNMNTNVVSALTRLNTLEDKVGSVSVPNLQTDVTSLQTDVGDLQTKVGNTSVSTQISNALANFSSGKTLTEHLAEEDMVLSSRQYGNTLPSPGTPGRIFFLKVSE